MSIQGDEYGKRTLDFVAGLQRLTKYDDICDYIVRELEWFGFTCATSWTVPGPDCALKDGIQFNNRPDEYIDRYVEKNYVVYDPVITELRRQLNPYSWNDIRQNRDLKKFEKEIMDEGREFGARDGFMIPIVTLSGSVSFFASAASIQTFRNGRVRRWRSSAFTVTTRCGAPWSSISAKKPTIRR